MVATKDEFIGDFLHVEVFDENSVMAHALIGEAFVPLAQLLLKIDQVEKPAHYSNTIDSSK